MNDAQKERANTLVRKAAKAVEDMIAEHVRLNAADADLRFLLCIFPDRVASGWEAAACNAPIDRAISLTEQLQTSYRHSRREIRRSQREN